MFEVKRTMIQCKQLPSGFGFYPRGTEVRFYPMTVKEIETLNESDLSSLMLFENSLSNIKTKGIDPKQLTFSDFIYVSLQRRLYSQTEIRCTLNTYCPICGTKLLEEFDFNEIEFDEPKDNRLQQTTLGGFKVDIGPITIGDMLDMLKSEEGVTTVNTLAHQIRKVYNPESDIIPIPDEEQRKLAYEIVANTYGEEREIFNYIDGLQVHNMKHKKMRCKNKACGSEWEVDLGNPETLIFPSSRPRQSIADKVHPV